MLQPGRSYVEAGTGYRYGFNGKEKDDEVKGAGNEIDFGARIYDTRIGRFLSTDPLAKKYAENSPFGFAANNPIMFIDAYGRDVVPSKAFLQSPYAAVYADLRTNNKAYLKIISKYVTSKSFNLTLNYSNEEVPKGYGAWTVSKWWGGSGPNGALNPVKAESKESFAPREVNYQNITSTKIYTYELTDIKKAQVIIHEGLHSYLAAKRDPEGSTHDVFNNYRTMMFDALKEYNDKRNLGYSDAQLTDLSYWGTQGTKQYKGYIQSLADKNQTTYEQEEKEYVKRITDISSDRVKVEERSDNSADSTNSTGNKHSTTTDTTKQQ